MGSPTFSRSHWRKVMFSGRKAAWESIIANGERAQRELQPYKCWWCEGWHIGHKRKHAGRPKRLHGPFLEDGRWSCRDSTEGGKP